MTNVVHDDNVNNTQIYYGGNQQVPKSVEKIIVHSTVTTIKPSAFDECGSLTSLVIPESVTTICDEAFRGCIAIFLELPGLSKN